MRDRPEEERVPLRIGALDKVSIEADDKTELEREKQVLFCEIDETPAFVYVGSLVASRDTLGKRREFPRVARYGEGTGRE